MKIFLTEDVLQVGKAGAIVNVSDGFARNYLLPRKLGIEVHAGNEKEFARRLQKIEQRVEVAKTKTSSLADRIKSVAITIKRRMHDDGKLYGSISEQEVVDALAGSGITISKDKVVFDKSIKAKGVHEVTIRLSSTLQPTCTVRVVPVEG
ncbi:MAG: 50S ribosomal protein L9 [Candidatus Babeliaceae bacterium]|nr:50S ribosomal protein L9 [Candidatus Babeliaceae bacterium]